MNNRLKTNGDTTENITIEYAKPDDAVFLSKMTHAFGSSVLGVSPIIYAHEIQREHVYVARNEAGKIIATLRLIYREKYPDIIEIGSVMKTAEEGKGIVPKIIEQVIADLNGIGKSLAFVTSRSNKGMVGIGEQCGFEGIYYPISNGLLKCIKKDREGDQNPDRTLFARRIDNNTLYAPCP